jgi:hypothetical protein
MIPGEERNKPTSLEPHYFSDFTDHCKKVLADVYIGESV